MRFVLSEIDGDRARLTTRRTYKNFWTKTGTLVFIKTKHNFIKAARKLGITVPEFKKKYNINF